MFEFKRKINTDSSNSSSYVTLNWNNSNKPPISFPAPFLPNNFSPWYSGRW